MKRLNSRVWGMIFFCFFFSPLYSQSYPNPIGYVNDYVGILTQEEKQRLTTLIVKLKQFTSVELAIAIIRSTQNESIDMYAVNLFTHWGIGEKGKDNGVLILVAIEDKKVWIETGYGVEGVLPDGFCGEVYRKILKPNFRRGEFGRGLILGVLKISEKICKEYKIEFPLTQTETRKQLSTYSKKRVCASFSGFLFLVLFFLFFGRFGLLWFLPFMFLGGSRSYWGNGLFGGSGGFGGFGGFGGGSCGGGGAGGSW